MRVILVSHKTAQGVIKLGVPSKLRHKTLHIYQSRGLPVYEIKYKYQMTFVSTCCDVENGDKIQKKGVCCFVIHGATTILG